MLWNAYADRLLGVHDDVAEEEEVVRLLPPRGSAGQRALAHEASPRVEEQRLGLQGALAQTRAAFSASATPSFTEAAAASTLASASVSSGRPGARRRAP